MTEENAEPPAAAAPTASLNLKMPDKAEDIKIGGDGDEDAQFTLRPKFQNKFRPERVKEILREVLQDKLGDEEYNSEQVSTWSREIAEEVKSRLKDTSMDRYKFVVQVIIGEQRGEGVRMTARCFWDADTDAYTSFTFMNDSLFAVCGAFGIYYY